MDKKGVSTIRSGLDSKKIGANMVFSSISFVLNILISFFVTPYITANIGADAYGFVKLAMDFANYASLVRIALNSMTSRFVMLSRENGRIQEAKSYYTSVTIANIVLAFVMLIPSAFLVFRLEYLLEIPRLLLFEVKLTFVWTLIEFLACMATATFVDSYYLANRLDLNSGVIAMASIVRVVSILVLFVVDIPKISYVALGGLISSVFFLGRLPFRISLASGFSNAYVRNTASAKIASRTFAAF